MNTLASAARAAEPTADGGRRRARVWWAGATAGAAAVLMLCYLRIAGTVPVLSDGAANALQARDMLHGNLLLAGWWVTDVSFLTTELPQYALVIAAAGLRPEVVHICAAITYTLLVLLVAYVARGRASGAEAVVRALVAAGIMLAPEPGVASWVLLSDPDHVGTGVPLLLLLLLLDRARGSRWVPVAAFVLLALASVGDPLAEVIGALPLAAVCLARVAVAAATPGRPANVLVRAVAGGRGGAGGAGGEGRRPADPGAGRVPDQQGRHRAHPAAARCPATGRWCCAACWRCSGPTSRTRPAAAGTMPVNLAFAAVAPGRAGPGGRRGRGRAPGGWRGRWRGWRGPAPATRSGAPAVSGRRLRRPMPSRPATWWPT